MHQTHDVKIGAVIVSNHEYADIIKDYGNDVKIKWRVRNGGGTERYSKELLKDYLVGPELEELKIPTLSELMS